VNDFLGERPTKKLIDRALAVITALLPSAGSVTGSTLARFWPRANGFEHERVGAPPALVALPAFNVITKSFQRGQAVRPFHPDRVWPATELYSRRIPLRPIIAKRSFNLLGPGHGGLRRPGARRHNTPPPPQRYDGALRRSVFPSEQTLGLCAVSHNHKSEARFSQARLLQLTGRSSQRRRPKFQRGTGRANDGPGTQPGLTRRG